MRIACPVWDGKGNQQRVAQLLMRTLFEVTEISFSPTVEMMENGSSASAVMETVWLDTVSIFRRLGAA